MIRLYQLVHRIGLHHWTDYVDLYDKTSGQHCSYCGARRELIRVDDSPWGVRSYYVKWVITRKSWKTCVAAGILHDVAELAANPTGHDWTDHTHPKLNSLINPVEPVKHEHNSKEVRKGGN